MITHLQIDFQNQTGLINKNKKVDKANHKTYFHYNKFSKINTMLRKIKSILSWIFPYEPTEKDVRKYYKNGSIFDKMTNEEKAEFLKPEKDLPLGL